VNPAGPVQIKSEYPPSSPYNYSNAMNSCLWNGHQALPNEQMEQLRALYNTSGTTIPLDVRTKLSDWIISKFAPSGVLAPPHFDAANNQAHAQLAEAVGSELAALIQSQASSEELKVLQHQIGSPSQLYVSVRRCLEQEVKILSQVPELAGYNSGAMGGAGAMDVTASEEAEDAKKDIEIKQQLDFLRSKVSESNGEVESYRQHFEKFTIDFRTFKERCEQHKKLVQDMGEQTPDVLKYGKENEQLRGAIQQQFQQLNVHQTAVLSNMIQLFEQVKQLQTRVLDLELIGWKHRQKSAGNGYKMPENKLDRLQVWCSGLAEIIWQMRQQVNTLKSLNSRFSDGNSQQQAQQIEMFLGNITELLSNLVTGTFVIEKQPPQVMKTNTRFSATVRLLVGSVLNIHMGAPKVYVSIVNETQANQLLSHASTEEKKKEDYACGDILNNSGAMEFHNTTRTVSCAFRNLQLKKIRRTEKKGQESVMDEKFAILVWTEFELGELRFQLWTFSLPVVVIVHGNQESQALSTIVWDNGFAEWGRTAFMVNEKVPWGRMGEVLSMKWKSVCGADLTEDQLYSLACKALRNNNLHRHNYNDALISWQHFCKELLPDRTFTFWEWFHRAMDLTQYRLASLWKEGHVMGFVDKQNAQNLLMNKQVGAFLLRFSDSELGGISITFKTQDESGVRVDSLYPFSKKDLEQRSMADIVFDITNLLFVVGSKGNEIPKESLKKFLTPPPGQRSGEGGAKPNPGYIRTSFKTTVEGLPPSQPCFPGGAPFNSPPQHVPSAFEQMLETLGPQPEYGGFKTEADGSGDADNSYGQASNIDFNGQDFMMDDVLEVLNIPTQQ